MHFNKCAESNRIAWIRNACNQCLPHISSNTLQFMQLLSESQLLSQNDAELYDTLFWLHYNYVTHNTTRVRHYCTFYQSMCFRWRQRPINFGWTYSLCLLSKTLFIPLLLTPTPSGVIRNLLTGPVLPMYFHPFSSVPSSCPPLPLHFHPFAFPFPLLSLPIPLFYGVRDEKKLRKQVLVGAF
jgi:hypothetical protein